MDNLVQLQPFDVHNQKLQQNVHPPDWTNPKPDGRYNLVVIGAGTAGLVTAAGAAGLGAKVALIERELMGGDCLNVGCVPSKAIITPARFAATIKQADNFGVRLESSPEIDFQSIMERMRKIRADISHHDSAQRFKDLGVDVYLGEGKFKSQHSIEVGGQSLEFKKAVIATGARAAKLPVDGVDEIGALTNESLFSLTELPERFVIVGAGPIGCEMAQVFARLGSDVTLIESAPSIMSREDPDAAEIVRQSLMSDGVNILTSATVVRFSQQSDVKLTVVKTEANEKEIRSDAVLIGTGRTPNVDGLGLENAGVEFDKKRGIIVDDKLRTTNKRIFAAGDVASNLKFTHAADFMARTIIQNALFLGRRKFSSLVIPWCTYTSPEIAHVGLTENAAKESGIEITTFTQDFSSVDRAILEGNTNGFARVHTRKGTDKIVGATIVANHAGEMIGEFTQAMTYGIGLAKIASTIHPYPTRADAIRKLGDQYNKTRLTPFVQKMFKRWLSWTR